jgi:mitogen-activated protein kinase kinase
MTNDLRRAIGGVRISDSDLTIRPGSSGRGAGKGKEPASSADLSDGLAKLPVGNRQGENGVVKPTASTVPDELVLEGNLEILGRLGEGASGEVKKARHTPTGLLMAKKVSKSTFC